MLFVISSNGNKTPITQTGSSVMPTGTGTMQEDLDSLVEMIDEDEEITDPVEIQTEEEVISNEVATSIWELTEKKGLFSFMNWGKDEENENEENEDEDSMQEAPSWSAVVENDNQGETVNSRDQFIRLAGDDASLTSQNVMKKSNSGIAASNANIQKYAPEILSSSAMYPGIDLETEIGKQFEIGVHSLKLNNMYFNDTLAYMMQGDSIKQLTTENSYGCFEVKITDSQLARNIGKTWYVCKKYLREAAEGKQVNNNIIFPEVTITTDTQIGDFITIEKSDVILWNDVLSAWDIVDQFSSGDEKGCFIVRVHDSVKAMNIGKVWTLCWTDLY
jgi:hypothetical protein